MLTNIMVQFELHVLDLRFIIRLQRLQKDCIILKCPSVKKNTTIYLERLKKNCLKIVLFCFLTGDEPF